MKMRLKLAMAIIPLGVIIAAVPENKTKPYKLSAQDMIEEVSAGTQLMSPDMIADLIVNKDPALQLIDVRSRDEYDTYHLPGAINIPLPDLLSADFEAYINQDVKMNVFYSNGTTKSNEAWMVTRQLGYQNNYVLQGGLNYWAENDFKPTKTGGNTARRRVSQVRFQESSKRRLRWWHPRNRNGACTSCTHASSSKKTNKKEGGRWLLVKHASQ